MSIRFRSILSFAVTAAVIAVICVGAARRQDADSRNDPPGYDVFLESVRTGVLARVPASPRGGKYGTANQAVAAATDFIAARSGIATSPEACARLLELQMEFEAGSSAALDIDKVAAAVTSWTVDDVLMTAGADEIEESIESARGFDAPDLPETFKNGRDRLRFAIGDPVVFATPEQARQAIVAARADVQVRDLVRTQVGEAVRRKLGMRLAYLNRADSSRFERNDISPVESVLLAYSLAADDMLAGSTAELRERMVERQKGLSRITGAPYPGHEGRLAYGANGYIVSSPAPVYFARLSSLLALLSEGGAQ